MATTLYRIIKYGLQGFWRNGWISFGATAVMVLVLFIFAGLIVFGVFSEQAINSLADKIDISVYFKTTAPEDEILKMKRSLENLAEVKSADYVSREQALEIFKERHKDDPTITEAVAILEGNPLSASLNIKAKNPKDYPIIATYLNTQSLNGLVEQVTYNQNQLVIKRLTAMVDTAERGGVALIVILSIVAILVVLNTIMLSIHSTHEEISIMRLVGASNIFIRGPYIVQGILYGFAAAVLSLILIAPLLSVASPYVKILIPEVEITSYFYSNLFVLFGYQLIFGIGLGAISSYIAVRRYLRV
ncbi:MAG: permease-like cell division protein FtsX [Candidatus Pacebacteria bacterium]|nr:permease-like cell division protein FtsX [Candidatus Paceibacterota bacterium]